MALPTPKRVKGLLELMDEALDMDAAKEAVARLGLKEGNTAADRAKAMGFSDDTFYHGTNKDFDSFDPTLKARVINSHLADGSRNATYVTPNTQQASDFARSLNKNQTKITFKDGVVMPLKIKGKFFDYDNVDDIDNLVKELKKDKTLKRLDPLYDSSFGITKLDTLEFDAKGGNWDDMEKAKIQNIIKNKGYDGYHVKEVDHADRHYKKNSSPLIKASAIYNPANIRSKFAKFNPKKAGIPLLTGGAGGAFMSSNLLAAPSGQPEFREAPMGFLDKAKKYAADSYEYAANEGGPVGKFLYSGGAEALKDIEQGTTPMVKTGRLPAMPTGAAIANLLELLQL